MTPPDTKLQAAFTRYKVLAFVTGTLLIILVFVGLPMHYWADQPLVSSVFGIAHGFLFPVYLVTALDLGIRLRWPWVKLGLIMVAGTVPFCSFIAERRAARDVAARQAVAR